MAFQHKADLNSECYELFGQFSVLNPPKQIKLLVFSNSKDVSSLEIDQITEISTDLKKHISKENRALTNQHMSIETSLKTVQKGQGNLESLMTKLTELASHLPEIKGRLDKLESVKEGMKEELSSSLEK